jgi:ABC-type multidrug transport system fused ATPase/permease subunit
LSAGAAIGWWIGWAVALVVILIAATLLLTIVALGRRIVRQADDITAAIDGARENTAPLFDVAATNSAIDRITRGLRTIRTGEPQPPPDSTLRPRHGEGHGPGEAMREASKERNRWS